MALDMFTQAIQTKHTEKPMFHEAGQTKKTDTFNGRDPVKAAEKDQPKFGEVLEKVQNENKGNSAEKQNETAKREEVRGKAEEIQAKIAAMKDDPNSLPPEVLEKITAILNQLMAVLNPRQNAKHTQADAMVSDSMPVTNMLDMMKDLLAQIDKMLESKPDAQTFMQTLVTMEKEIAKMQTPVVKATADNSPAKVELNTENKLTNNPSPDKVKVVDMRERETQPVEKADGSKPKDFKELMPKDKSQTAVKDTNANNIAHTRSEKEAAAQTVKNGAEMQNAKIDAKIEAGPVARQYQTFANSVSRANMESIMQGVVGKAVVVLQDGRSEMKMNLVPPELGKMRLNFELEHGELVGKIVVSTQEAKMLFDQNLGNLQRSLQDAGVNVASLDVSLQQGDGGNPEQADVPYGADGALTAEAAAEAVFEPFSIYESSLNLIA
jgi:flagellar hook-length control protein FliK